MFVSTGGNTVHEFHVNNTLLLANKTKTCWIIESGPYSEKELKVVNFKLLYVFM